MKRSLFLFFACLALAVTPVPGSTQESRQGWDKVAGPQFVSVSLAQDRSDTLRVAFRLEIGAKGAGRATVTMTDVAGATLETKLLGRSSKEIKTAEFKPPKSGTYLFSIAASRTGVAEAKDSETISFDFSLPLTPLLMQARNMGKGAMLLSWEPVKEAEYYIASWKPENAAGNGSGDATPSPFRRSGAVRPRPRNPSSSLPRPMRKGSGSLHGSANPVRPS